MEKKFADMKNNSDQQIQDFKEKYINKSASIQQVHHQLEMFSNQNMKLMRDMQVSDFYLNKIMPVS